MYLRGLACQEDSSIHYHFQDQLYASDQLVKTSLIKTPELHREKAGSLLLMTSKSGDKRTAGQLSDS